MEEIVDFLQSIGISDYESHTDQSGSTMSFIFRNVTICVFIGENISIAEFKTKINEAYISVLRKDMTFHWEMAEQLQHTILHFKKLQ